MGASRASGKQSGLLARAICFVAAGLLPWLTPAAAWGQIPSANFRTIIPHSAFGGGFLTRLFVANLTNNPNAVTINRINQGGVVVQTTNVLLAPGGTLLLADAESQRTQPLTIQWFAIGSQLPITASDLFDFDSQSLGLPQNFRTAVGVLSAEQLSALTFPVRVVPDVVGGNNAKVTVGIALANLNASTNTVTLTLLDKDGNIVAQDFLALGPFGQVAFSLQERAAFKNIILGVPEFVGAMAVTTANSNQPVAAIVVGNNLDQLFSLPVSPGVAVDPVATSQQGSLLVLETLAPNQHVRVGLETQWGGGVAEVSLNGTNFVNRAGVGRLVAVAVYDGNADYDPCAGCTGVFGWDPVQGGDEYDHGSPVLKQSLTPNSIFIKTQPLEWNPDDKGGGPDQAVPGDVFLEQTLSPLPGHLSAFKLHYKVTHFGSDNHANFQDQEFPGVYVNLGFDRMVFYSGQAPWTNDTLTVRLIFDFPPEAPGTFFNSEKWVSLVDNEDVGLTIFVPTQYPHHRAASFPGTPGPTGTGTNYVAPRPPFSFTAGSILEGDIYLIAGNYQSARSIVYELHSQLSPADIFTPVGFFGTNGATQGIILVSGWTFDDTGVAQVGVFVDGIFAGTATYGFPRPDVQQAGYVEAPLECGFEFALDTTLLPNGMHTIEVRVTDTAGHVAVFRRVNVNVQN